MKKYVTVRINGLNVTIRILVDEVEGVIQFNNSLPEHEFIDSDKLYLEDEDGYRYKRIFSDADIPKNFFRFKRI